MAGHEPFHRLSYRLHEKHFDDYRHGGARASHALTWFDPGSVDAWRHRRLYRVLDPLLDAFPASSWLTVGDGRYGTDAHYIRSKGVSALATDISDALLTEGFDRGFIDAYQKENAEALSFADAAFDFVLCKESFHHFPRPTVALYEMLRVSRRAVVLIEPNDALVQPTIVEGLLLFARRLQCRLLHRPPPGHQFEESGNFVYSLSKREMEKVAQGINLGAVAFKGINDYYEKGVEHTPAATDNPLFIKTRRKIRFRDVLAVLRIRRHSMLAAVLFHRVPETTVEQALRTRGFDFVRMPQNPYIGATGDTRRQSTDRMP